jgi:hypothetical protein
MDQSQAGTAYSTQADLRSVQLSSGVANKYIDNINRGFCTALVDRNTSCVRPGRHCS